MGLTGLKLFNIPAVVLAALLALCANVSLGESL